MNRFTSSQKKLLNKIEKQTISETYTGFNIVWHATAIALRRLCKWTEKDISDLYEVAESAWADCRNDSRLSMVLLCERETGIEIRAQSKASFHDIKYLNDDPNVSNRLSAFEYIRMKQNQVMWIRPQILASVLIGLHRLDNWEELELELFLNSYTDVVDEFNHDPELLKEESIKEAGFELRNNMI